VPGCETPELEKEKPGQELGFTPVGMAESDNTAALTGQGPFKGIKEYLFSPQNNFGYPVKKEKVEPAQEPEKQNNKFRNPRFRYFKIRRNPCNRCLIGSVHLQYNFT